MLRFITKKEYFENVKKKYSSNQLHNLKNIQDGVLLRELIKIKNSKILEMGGGHSRVLPLLSKSNECWNVDKMVGQGNGPSDLKNVKKYKLIRSYIGDYDSEIPEKYFNILFSISVLEHVIDEDLNNMFDHTNKIMKEDGTVVHVFDCYIGDSIESNLGIRNRIQRIIETASANNLELLAENEIDMSNLKFKTNYATNSDLTVYRWWRSNPSVSKFNKQNCSIIMILKKKKTGA